MHTRIKMIRQEEGLTQSQFADKIGLSRNYVAMIEIAQRDPSDRTISDICRIFDIREEWLRNGEEPMRYSKESVDTEYINELLAAADNPFMDLIKSVMKVYMELSPEDKKKATDFARSLKEKVKESQD